MVFFGLLSDGTLCGVHAPPSHHLFHVVIESETTVAEQSSRITLGSRVCD